MQSIWIEKSVPLEGKVVVSSAKNAVLPIMAATLLTGETCTIHKMPRLSDVQAMVEVLNHLGSQTHMKYDNLIARCEGLVTEEAPYEAMRRLRASVLVMGPLLARFGKARLPLPGGCNIGVRPVDLHLKGFRALGAEITLGNGYVTATAPRLTGARIYLDFPSVGATENLLMAACLAKGTTILENAAKEPEIMDLGEMLMAMGAKIKGLGSDFLIIEGARQLSGVEYTPIPDRVEAGTFMVGAAMTGGNVLLQNVRCAHLRPVLAKLREAGATITEYPKSLRIKGGPEIHSVDIKSLPYPGFPTDMQPQMMALCCLGDGTSVITETVFENRFLHVGELKRMGADILIDDRSAVVKGVSLLQGTKVEAPDLRAGAALILAGLAAEGVTQIMGLEHIDRGYDRLEEKLRSLGASIERRDA